MEKREYRIGICDDKEEDVERIKEALRKALQRAKTPVRFVCRYFTDGEELCASACKITYELIFLDLEMPGMDGAELAERLCMNHPSTYLVFVSVHESFVFDAYEYSPLWFVRKSNLEEDMFRALRKYLQVTAYTRVNYRMKEGFGNRDVPVMDILYIEGTGHSLTIKRTDGSLLKKYGSLKSMEKELVGCHFLRIHKNYLVNQEYIKEVGRCEVYLTDGSILEMGRDRKNEIREAMRSYEHERRQRRFS